MAKKAKAPVHVETDPELDLESDQDLSTGATDQHSHEDQHDDPERQLMDRAADEAADFLAQFEKLGALQSVLSADEQWLAICSLRAMMLHLNRGEWEVARRTLENFLAQLADEAEEQLEKLDAPSLVTLHDLGLPVRVVNMLEEHCIETLADLRAASNKRLLKIPNLSLLTMSEIRLAEKRWHDGLEAQRRRIAVKLNARESCTGLS